MFTSKTVRTVADYANVITGRQFGLSGVGGDIGNGVRYIDLRQQKVWFGPRGSRQAASYYLGVIDSFNHGIIGDLPQDVNEVRRMLIGNGWNQSEYDRGCSDANDYMQYHIDRETFSLAALQAMPVVHQGHYGNIIFNHGGVKISLSRMTVADGTSHDHMVTVEKINDRHYWEVVREYQAV